MKSKRVLAAIISLLAAFSLLACKSSKQTTMVQVETVGNNVVYNEVPQDVQSNDVVATDAAVENNQQQSTQAVQAEATTAAETTASAQEADDPASWSTDRIVEEYKNAARKSTAGVTSKQSIALKSISVNNGEYANVMDFVGGIMGKFLESNSTEKAGITGGFENMVAGDVSSAKAYKQGDDTVIELVMLEQTAGAREDANSGSVGHAITAVGDIAVVVDDLASRGLPLELSEEETKIYYTNPSVKVVINSNGEIVSGTWFYTVEIKMDNFKAFGQNVNTASIIMDNTITV